MLVDLGASVAAVASTPQREGVRPVGRGPRGCCGPGLAKRSAGGIDNKNSGCDEDEGVIEKEGNDLGPSKGAGQTVGEDGDSYARPGQENPSDDLGACLVSALAHPVVAGPGGESRSNVQIMKFRTRRDRSTSE